MQGRADLSVILIDHSIYTVFADVCQTLCGERGKEAISVLIFFTKWCVISECTVLCELRIRGHFFLDSPPSPSDVWGFCLGQVCGCYVTKYAPHLAPKLNV